MYTTYYISTLRNQCLTVPDQLAFDLHPNLITAHRFATTPYRSVNLTYKPKYQANLHTKMQSATHTIDPDGEVIIILRNANSPFAQLEEDAYTHQCVGSPQLSFDNLASSDGLTTISELNYERTEQSDKMKSRKKDKKKKAKKYKRECSAEESAVGAPMAEGCPVVAEEWPVDADESTVEAPMTEESAANGEESTVMAFVAEECTADAEESTVGGPIAEEPLTECDIDQNCSRIQVSAKHLMLASPFFKRLLTGGWKESVTYFQKGSVEIIADGWDIEALMILLRAIHGKYRDIPRKLPLEMLAKVAVIADYYECREVLDLLAEVWIEKMDEKIPSATSRDLVLWLWISWFFRLPEEFQSSTSIAMSQSYGCIDTLELPIPEDITGESNCTVLNLSKLTTL